MQGALPGKRVKAKVLKVKKQYVYAKQLELLQSSPDRVDAPCPIYKQCGGCQAYGLRSPTALKHQHVVDNLERIEKLPVRGRRPDRWLLCARQPPYGVCRINGFGEGYRRLLRHRNDLVVPRPLGGRSVRRRDCTGSD